MIYECVWVPIGDINDEYGMTPEKNAPLSNVMNEYASSGWQVLSLSPGTNAKTKYGMFVTFMRQE